MVSILSGGVTLPLFNHAADMLIGIQLMRDRGAAIRQDVNKPTRLMFLAGDDQKEGSVIIMEAVASRDTNEPTQTAVLSAFQFDFENGAIATPTTSQVAMYCMDTFQSSKLTKVV
jgi:hypothetical protein